MYYILRVNLAKTLKIATLKYKSKKGLHTGTRSLKYGPIWLGTVQFHVCIAVISNSVQATFSCRKSGLQQRVAMACGCIRLWHWVITTSCNFSRRNNKSIFHNCSQQQEQKALASIALRSNSLPASLPRLLLLPPQLRLLLCCRLLLLSCLPLFPSTLYQKLYDCRISIVRAPLHTLEAQGTACKAHRAGMEECRRRRAWDAQTRPRPPCSPPWSHPSSLSWVSSLWAWEPGTFAQDSLPNPFHTEWRRPG